MIIDDRLATVLATPLLGGAGGATQVRQLIDLLDRQSDADWNDEHEAALGELSSRLASLPEPTQVQIAAEARLRSSRVVAELARGRPRVAAAALAEARLSDPQWLDLIPRLSPLARGLLRHRPDMGRDRGSEPARLLARLGVTDAALPLPEGYEAEAALITAAPPLRLVPAAEAHADAKEEPAQSEGEEARGIGAIVQRIEAIRRIRAAEGEESTPGSLASLLGRTTTLTAIDLAIDPSGTIRGAEGAAAAMLVGHRPFTADRRAPAYCDPATLLAARQRRPVRAGRVAFEGAPAIAGDWRIDAIPCFDTGNRSFTGWKARLRRPRPEAKPANDIGERDAAAALPEADDRLRQTLHELKNPLNVIQGYAELIQQQVVGEVPHQYRGLAASIMSDAAAMLAQFEAIDQLIRLESGHQAIEPGETEARHALTELTDRLAPLFDGRGASLAFQPGDEPLLLGIAPRAFEAMAWRLLSTIAGAAANGEQLPLRLGREGDFMRLSARLPHALADDASASGGDQSVLGRDFALRLLAAEARAAGGLVRKSERFLTILIPLLTQMVTNSSPN